MNETELLHAMCEAYWRASPGITNSMRNILELLHANGYRRCAEGQRTTQYCSAWEQADKACRDLTEKVIPNIRERAEKAEAEVERLRAVIDGAPHHPDCLSHYACMVGGFCEPGQLTMPRSVQYKCNCWKFARGES